MRVALAQHLPGRLHLALLFQQPLSGQSPNPARPPFYLKRILGLHLIAEVEMVKVSIRFLSTRTVPGLYRVVLSAS